MNLFVPVTRFRVRYEIGAGDPYSELHALVLRAIASAEATTEKQLADLFLIPERLVIEILVGLSKVGLIAIETSPDQHLVATSQGRTALAEGGAGRYRIVLERKTDILMECVTGGVANGRGIRCETQKKLEQAGRWDPRRRLPFEFADPRIDEGQISHLLPRADDEWIRWIASPEIVSRNYLWLLVSADMQRGRVFNLPEIWQGRLEPYLLDHARELSERFGADEMAPSTAPVSAKTEEPPKPTSLASVVQARSWNAVINHSDVLFGTKSHAELLRGVLQSAHSTILIVSSSIDPASLESGVAAGLQTALARGVQVDILWGSQSGDKSVPVAPWLKKIGRAAKSALAGLRFNLVPSNWRANMIVYDDLNEQFQAIVGSHAWLAADSGLITKPVSIRVEQPGIVADICRSAAGLWSSAPTNKLSKAPDRWRQLAAALEQRVTEQGEEITIEDEPLACQISLVREQSHAPLLRTCIRTAQSRLGLFSQSMGQGALRSLKALAERPHTENLDFRIHYGQVATQEAARSLDPIQEQVIDVGGVVERRAGLRGNVAIADVTALVTSYDLLGWQPNNGRGGDVGLLIEGGSAAEYLWEDLTRPLSYATAANGQTSL
jgi:hypothetical protein